MSMISGVDSDQSTQAAQFSQMRAQRDAQRDKAMAPVAQLLGVSTDDLKSDMKSGKTLASLAAAKGIPEAKLESTIAQGLKDNPPSGVNTSSSSVDFSKMATDIATGKVGGHHHHHGGSGGQGSGVTPALADRMSSSNDTSTNPLAALSSSLGIDPSQLLSSLQGSSSSSDLSSLLGTSASSSTGDLSSLLGSSTSGTSSGDLGSDPSTTSSGDDTGLSSLLSQLGRSGVTYNNLI